MKKHLSLFMLIVLLIITIQLSADNIEGDYSDKDYDGKDNLSIVSIVWEAMVALMPDEGVPISLDLESAAVFTGYSDVQIPGNTGTFFSLSDDFKAKIAPAGRFRITWYLGERHSLAVLSALLRVKSEGTAPKDIVFAGETFTQGTELEGIYWFNSHRVTYRYDFLQNWKNDLGIGFTAKIREAGIRLKGDGKTASKTNVGFVPIINFRYKRYINENLCLLLEGDALAAPQGRAEDIFAGVLIKLHKNAKLKVGYRMLEGGADNDEVYNFGMFHYATLGFAFENVGCEKEED
ncbi:MAG: hypothetical protein FJ041_03570 [Candidatus Cloacimonetes bacterium]|nr:hypothetical protein [Candidatus Cloacimonadota bacterium]